MRDEFNVATAFELGAVARNRAIEDGNQICRQERERLELTNKAEVIECRARLRLLSDERDEIRRFLHGLLDHSADTRQRRRYYITVALILGLAGFSFSHLALAPFGLGIYIWPYAAGLAVVCAVLTDMFLEKCGSVRIIQGVVAAGLVASLSGLIILAVIRGDIVLLYLKTALVGSVPGADAVIAVGDGTQFYQATARKLQLFFAFLAASMELATGLAIWEARKIAVTPSDVVDRARRRLTEIDGEMPLLVGRITFLENEPRSFEAEFQRDFHRGLLVGQERRGVMRVGPLLLAGLVGFALASTARAQDLMVVTLTDFSRSDVVSMHNGTTAHQENIEAAAKIIAGLPPGAKFTVIGITAKSFSQPLILVSGQIPLEQGPLTLLNRVTLVRETYASELRKAATAVEPSALKTDILGALMLSADIFRQAPRKRSVLTIFGDMRQSSSPVNIEDSSTVPVTAAMKTTEQTRLIANLNDVEVFVYGVHAAGKNVAYWQSLHEFWKSYFAKSGATLRTFSMLREIPDLQSTAKD